MFDTNIKEAINHINVYIENKNKTINNKTILSSFLPSGNKINKDHVTSKMSNFKKNNIDNLPVKDNPNLINIKNYLINKRLINKKIINDLINKGLIYADNKKNCVFTNNKYTFSLSKGIGNVKFNKCSGIPDFITYGPISDVIFLFESPIDALSYKEIYNENNGTLISTNGEMMINKVIKYIKNNNIKKVFTCFDNDEKGNKYHDIIQNDAKNNNIFIEIIRKKPFYKDFNEDLKYFKKLEILK